jgi:hypothetical protein
MMTAAVTGDIIPELSRVISFIRNSHPKERLRDYHDYYDDDREDNIRNAQ